MTFAELQDRTMELAEAMHRETIEAEARCQAMIVAPVSELRAAYSNRAYWAKYGPMIDGMLMTWKAKDAIAILHQELDVLASKYDKLAQMLEVEYEANCDNG